MQHVAQPYLSCMALASRQLIESKSVWDFEKLISEMNRLAFGYNLNVGSPDEGIISVELGPGDYGSAVRVEDVCEERVALKGDKGSNRTSTATSATTLVL